MAKTADKAGKLKVVIVSASGLAKAEEAAAAAAATLPRPFSLLRGSREGSASARSPGPLLARGCDPFVVCEVVGKPELRFETPIVRDTLEPVWNFEHTFSEFSAGDSLTFTVWDKEVGQKSEHLGQVTIEPMLLEGGLDDGVLLSGRKQEAAPKLWLRISPLEVAAPDRPKGKPSLSSYLHTMRWLQKGDNPAIGTPLDGNNAPSQPLKVKIISASGLRGADWIPGEGSNTGLSDPYCTVEIMGKPQTRQQTAVIKECHDPEWNFEGHFDDYVTGDTLFFAVWDEDWGKSDDLLGCSELPSLHFDPVAFEGDIRLADAGVGNKSLLRVRVELANFQNTLGVSSSTGLGIRRKLWSTWSKYAHVPVTQNMESAPTVTGMHLRQRFRSVPGKLTEAVAKQKRAAKLVLIDMAWARRDMAMRAMRDTIKEACIADPDMCLGLRRWLSNVVDALWCDIMVEVEIMVESTRLGVAGHSWHDVESLAEVGRLPPNLCHPLSIRGFLLYHFLPYDRSFFGQLKDPVYLLFLALSFVPVLRCFFYLAVLLLEVIPGPPDEYQLVQFIIGFKATQFLSSGIFLALVGTWKYYWCVERNGTHICETHGPGESRSIGRDLYGDLGVIDIVGSCMLIWTAFLLLPHSQQNAGLRKTDAEDQEVALVDDDQQGDCCGHQWHRFQYEGRGGRLGGLLRYDLRCFLCCLFLLVFLEMWRYHEDPKALIDLQAGGLMHTWKFRETLFVIRVLYGFLAFPFAVFNLPVLSQILTHTVPTGYNRRGAAVAYLLPPVDPLEPPESPRSSRSLSGTLPGSQRPEEQQGLMSV